MAQTPAQILSEFIQKLEGLKSRSLAITDQYLKAKEKVLHHITLCKLQDTS
jgi:hypothetical protein